MNFIVIILQQMHIIAETQLRQVLFCCAECSSLSKDECTSCCSNLCGIPVFHMEHTETTACKIAMLLAMVHVTGCSSLLQIRRYTICEQCEYLDDCVLQASQGQGMKKLKHGPLALLEWLTLPIGLQHLEICLPMLAMNCEKHA